MNKKILSFLVLLCLCMGIMPSINAHAFSPGNGKCRLIRVNGSADVSVYDDEGNLLAAIIDDTPQPDSDLVASYTDEGEKLVYLPVYHEYVVKLTTTGDGIMNYAVWEEDPYAMENASRMVLFQDIEAVAGQEYTAYLPSYSKQDIESMKGTASGTEYTLFLGTEQILPGEELTGEAISNAWCDIDIVSENAEKGFAFGSGMPWYGTFMKATAFPLEGYEFEGWYEEGNLVSIEPEYQFRVDRDAKLVAVFKEAAQDQPLETMPTKTTPRKKMKAIGIKMKSGR